MVLRALTTPAGPSTETIEQIGAYGFAGALPDRRTEAGPGLRARLDDLTGGLGRWLGQRFSRLKGPDYRARLVAAGMYTTTPERLLGTQFLSAVGSERSLWLGLGGCSVARRGSSLLGSVGAAVLGWMLPTFIVDAAREEAARAGRARPARPDRPPRRDARGRAQLSAVAPSRRREDQASRSRARFA